MIGHFKDFVVNAIVELSKRIFKKKYLETVYIETSSRCNLVCTYCYRTGNRYSTKNKLMGYDVFRKIIEEFPNQIFKKPMLFLHGYGEPTLNDQLVEMVRLAKSSGKFSSVNFVSNLLAVKKEKYHEYFEAGLTTLYISLDSLNEEKISLGRKGTYFAAFMESFSYIAEYYAKKITVITVLSSKNKDEIFSLHDFIRKNKITGWNIQLLNLRNGGFDISIEDVEFLINKLNKMKSAITINFEQEGQFKCQQPFTSMIFNADGYMTPCCSMTDSDRINFGNVKTETVCNLFSSVEFERFRARFSKQRPDICEKCPYY